MPQKKRVRENIEIEYNGSTYTGERVIEGTLRLDQYVVFNLKCLPDLKGYLPAEKDKQMLVIAKNMLWELVSGRTLSAKDVSKYGL